jgi:hypothetical protein
MDGMKHALKLCSPWLAAIPALALACGPPAPPNDSPQPKPPPPPTSTTKMVFENPGGMWTPQQLADHAEVLKKLGLELDAAALTDPMKHPLGAVVWLGGCSASFVSPDGLIITNHHCATGALQFNSNKESNLLENGFLAKTREEEKSNGPSARVYVTQAFRDVTKTIRAGLAEEKDDLARYEIVEQREKDLVGECEKGREDLRCSVVSYFGGEQYMLIEQLEIRDVRLVHAPARGIGNFGGEIDNWRWPRHTGDYSFFRAYVGPDGKPADFARENVPYRPADHLKLASTPLGKGDMVFVAGYPARTTRLRTSAEVKEAVDWYYPRRLKLTNDYIALLEDLAKQDEELAIKGQRLLRGLSNVRTNTQGMIDGLNKGGLAQQKKQEEQALRAWIAKHPKHARGAAAMDNLAKHYAKYRAKREADAAMWEIMFMSKILSAADTIVHMAEERPKPDAERDPRFQERNHKRLAQAQRHAQRTYDRRLDKALLTLALYRAGQLPKKDQPKIVGLILGEKKPTKKNIEAALAPMYDKTQLESVDRRVELLEKASTAALKKSKDPFIALALKLRPLVQASDDRADAYAGATMMDRPAFAAALRASRGGILAPDANSTLRITYGTVRGYRPKPDAEPYEPFTKLSGMVKKQTGKDPFDAPEDLIAKAKSGPYEPYVHEPIGEVPVDFLADLDITGGNSGSPTLNARGELVGLAFDGNYEAMASDWVFIPEITRSIHVDIRYVLWIMDYVEDADHLLKEMGLEPH